MDSDADDSPSDDNGLDGVCTNIENLGEKYNMSATNIKSVLKCLYNPEIITKVLSYDTQGIPTLKITRSKAGPSRSKIVDESCTQMPRAQRTFLNVDYDEEDAFDGDYEPENDPTFNEIDVEDESESESGNASSSESETALELELERELELLKEPLYPVEPEAFKPHEPIEETHDRSADMQLNLDDMLYEEISERVPWKYSTRSKANLNLTATSDALEEEKRELFASCSHQEVYSNVDPEYLGFCQSINAATMVLPDDEDGDPEFVPATCEFEEIEKEPEEIRRDRATEITKRETTALLTDLTVEETELFLTGIAPTEELINEINSKRRRQTRTKIKQSNDGTLIKETARNVAYGNSARLKGEGHVNFRECELTQLKTQLEQHVQLLTQMAVSCYFDEELMNFRGRFLEMLKDLDQYFYEYGESSLFNIENMPAAILTCHRATKTQKIVDWEPSKNVFLQTESSTVTHARTLPRPEVSLLLRTSEAILYPELIPECSMILLAPRCSFRSSFTDSEDLLLVMGLMEFGHIEKHKARASNRGQKKSLLISKHLLPTKKPEQIEYHLRKTCKDKARDHMSQMIIQANNGILKLDWIFNPPLRINGPMDSWPPNIQPFWLKNQPRMESPIPMTPTQCISPQLEFTSSPIVNSPRCISPSCDIPFTPQRKECSVMWSPSMKSNQSASIPVANPARMLFSSAKEKQEIDVAERIEPQETAAFYHENSNSSGMNQENTKENDDISVVSATKRKFLRAQRNRMDEQNSKSPTLDFRGNNLLISKIKADIDLRLSLHNDVRNRLYGLILEGQDSVEMWRKMEAILLPLHEHVLCLLSFIFPMNLIPSDYLKQPLRRSYENAFELLLTIERYSPSGKMRFNQKQILKQLLDICIEVNYNENELWNRLETLLSNHPALLKHLKRKCPWSVTNNIVDAQSCEFINLTSVSNEESVNFPEIGDSFETIDDISAILSTKAVFKKGTSCCVSGGRLQVYTSGQYITAEPNYDKKSRNANNLEKNEKKLAKSTVERSKNWSIEDDVFLVNVYNQMEEELENIVTYASKKLEIPESLVEERLKFLISLQQGLEDDNR